MARKPVFTCFKNFNDYELPRLFFAILYPAMYAMCLVILFSASPAHAEVTKVFTDSDLENYNAEPMVDQETLSSREEDLKSFIEKRSAALLLESERIKKQQAEEAKRLALQKKTMTVSVQSSNNKAGYAAPRTTASNQRSANNSLAGPQSSPVRTGRT